SVGEAMAIGRSMAESLQKALRSLETGLKGLDPVVIPGAEQDGAVDREAVLRALTLPTPNRLLVAGQALRHGLSVEDIHAVTHYEPWFLRELKRIVDAESALKKNGLPHTRAEMLHYKALGFSDAQMAAITGQKEADVRALRTQLNVHPVYKRIDTCAAEFEARTPYMYSTYETDAVGAAECEAQPTDAKKIMILGGGPNRIGQGIEFDYCCCHAAFALSDAGFETIMVNCNPETVSTDYDTSDRLYFEPLTAEDVLEIIRTEQQNGTFLGVIVQFGGQTPLKLAKALEAANVP